MAEILSPSASNSAAASKCSEAWTKTLAFRISLQRSLDLANMMPVTSHIQSSGELQSTKADLLSILSDLTNMLSPSTKAAHAPAAKDDLQNFWWPHINRGIASKRPKWETTVNQWQTRLRLHSTGLKAFSQTIWDQVVSLNYSPVLN